MYHLVLNEYKLTFTTISYIFRLFYFVRYIFKILTCKHIFVQYDNNCMLAFYKETFDSILILLLKN